MPVVLNKVVKEVIIGLEEKAGYKLNRIVFVDNTYAMEKCIDFKSQFYLGFDMDYEVTHPGKGDKPDWIRAIGFHQKRTTYDKKDFLIMAQHAMTCATNICITKYNPNTLEAELVIQMAKQIARGTLNIAQELIEEHV